MGMLTTKGRRRCGVAGRGPGRAFDRFRNHHGRWLLNHPSASLIWLPAIRCSFVQWYRPVHRATRPSASLPAHSKMGWIFADNELTAKGSVPGRPRASPWPRWASTLELLEIGQLSQIRTIRGRGAGGSAEHKDSTLLRGRDGMAPMTGSGWMRPSLSSVRSGMMGAMHDQRRYDGGCP